MLEENTYKKQSEKKYMRGAEPFFKNQNAKTGILLLHGFSATPYQFKGLRSFFTEKGILHENAGFKNLLLIGSQY